MIKMVEYKARCMRCKKEVTVKNPVETTIRNGKVRAVKGVCSVCGTKVFRILGKK